MKVQIRITKDFAITAISHRLSYGDEQVSSRKKFREVISDYLLIFGKSNIDDHDMESSDYLYEATEIVNKYFNP